jgi:diguanylate cyclase (GGDEF)-like protein
MEGYDRDWVSAGERKFAMYTNLNPGTYRFLARVEGQNQREGAGSVLAVLVIARPLYLEWYAFVFYFMLLVFAVYAGYKIRKNIMLEKKIGELELTTDSLKSANSELKNLSFNDALTGIPNRRFFEHVLVHEWEAARVRQDSLSVLMIDIDFFKLFNDTYGHLAGDEALKKVASAVQSALFRVSDVVARFGGEEFIVILPDTNRENALFVCERIMHNITLADIPFKTEIAEQLSISIGCYTRIPDSAGDFTEYIQRADEALYTAKKEGRNRISVYPWNLSPGPERTGIQ